MRLKAKILSLFITTLALTQAAYCTNTSPDCIIKRELRDGLYAGAGLGYDSYWMRQNFNFKAPVAMTGTPRMNAPGWVGSLLAGYGKYLWHTWYLGGEIFGGYSQANEKYYLTNDRLPIAFYSTSFDARSYIGFSVLTGMRLNEIATGYIRFGSTWATFHTQEISRAFNVSKQSTVAGPNYGLGVEILLNEGWSLRGEYTHTNNDSFATILGSNFDPSDNQAMIAVLYHFGV